VNAISLPFRFLIQRFRKRHMQRRKFRAFYRQMFGRIVDYLIA